MRFITLLALLFSLSAFAGVDQHYKDRGLNKKQCLNVNDAGTQTDYLCANPATHGVDINGRTDGSGASSGKVGQFIVGTSGGAVAPSGGTGSGVQVASIPLPAGNYLVFAHAALSVGTVSGFTGLVCGISATAGNNFTTVGDSDSGYFAVASTTFANPRINTGPIYLGVATTTTYYLNCGVYASSYGTASFQSGQLYALRVN